MSSVSQPDGPTRLADAIAALIDRCDVVELQLRLRLQAWRDGYAAGELAHADDYDRGYADAIAMVKRTEHQLVRVLDDCHVRWVVRGQQRTRQTFGQRHNDDYPGRGEAA